MGYCRSATLTCPACSGPMRIVAFITERAVIERILAHLASRATRASAPGGRREARAPPSTSQARRRRTHSSPVRERAAWDRDWNSYPYSPKRLPWRAMTPITR